MSINLFSMSLFPVVYFKQAPARLLPAGWGRGGEGYSSPASTGRNLTRFAARNKSRHPTSAISAKGSEFRRISGALGRQV